ncbi:hypothetical protein KIH31_05390 [Paenarthrobacter sp. DKR-5]|uniref:HGxxPAAW family protein n=1 Tax=Paenarthrobacter sp. DKR-5 TaxID=2835535 RepID=UPI001BDC6095|nr:HGxxPAAW family protein [Paenarthrobacter sp. DKR-5]MBT1002031.1 hypothetical protein [Paenarthrobacter sp. DKR-5]
MSNDTTTGTTQESHLAAGVTQEAADLGHGNSPAAWTCVVVMLVGALVSSFAFAWANATLFWGGVIVMAIGLLLGWGMKRAGYGVGGSKLKNNGH